MLIVCGAKKTEEAYLRGLRDSVPNPSVDVEVLLRPKSPEQVVEHAAKHRDSSSNDFDEVWCVVDVDQFAIDGARTMAKAHGIQLAISDPCFELWLLLHHCDCTAHLADCGAAKHLLLKKLPSYDKRSLVFGDFAMGVQAAIERAQKLGDDGNPSTGMWRLALRILDEEASA